MCNHRGLSRAGRTGARCASLPSPPWQSCTGRAAQTRGPSSAAALSAPRPPAPFSLPPGPPELSTRRSWRGTLRLRGETWPPSSGRTTTGMWWLQEARSVSAAEAAAPPEALRGPSSIDDPAFPSFLPSLLPPLPPFRPLPPPPPPPLPSIPALPSPYQLPLPPPFSPSPLPSRPLYR